MPPVGRRGKLWWSFLLPLRGLGRDGERSSSPGCRGFTGLVRNALRASGACWRERFGVVAAWTGNSAPFPNEMAYGGGRGLLWHRISQRRRTTPRPGRAHRGRLLAVGIFPRDVESESLTRCGVHGGRGAWRG